MKEGNVSTNMQESRQLPSYSIKDKSLITKWKLPQKRIFSSSDIPSFQSSKAIANINGIVSLICTKISLVNVPLGALNDELVNFNSKGFHHSVTTSEKVMQKHRDTTSVETPPKFADEAESRSYSTVAKAILGILQKFKDLKDQTPPFPGPRRYGNFACRDWHDKLTSNIDSILDEAFFDLLHEAEKSENYLGLKNEIRYYLLGSFGSRERLDYGTGHELSFVSFLGCLVMIDLINREEMKGSEWLLILAGYYDLVKSLILSYTLEPAGSHGVWGLDDHFHLIYVFGACQLVDFKTLGANTEFQTSNTSINVMNYRMGLTPSSILNPDTLRRERDKNLYYNAISFIRMVKVGPFSEHSPILYEISASKNWEKIARGMLRMYYGEVLSKFPVVQHFYFGGVFFPWVDTNGHELRSSENQSELLSETPNAETHKNVDNGNRYIESVTSTMGTFYPDREDELSKLLQERRKVTSNGKVIRGITTSRDAGTDAQRQQHNPNTVHQTRVPWETKSGGNVAVDFTGTTRPAGPSESAGTTGQTGHSDTKVPWK